tara:strand:- start:314 stop:457 length:144 start_codon:yes stop_codon:yes gene_type:complete
MLVFKKQNKMTELGSLQQDLIKEESKQVNDKDFDYILLLKKFIDRLK